MQLSPRAARDSRIEGQETAEPSAQASPLPERRWYSGLVSLFGAKAAPQKAADANTSTNSNALLAFPSETVSRLEPAPKAEAAKRPAPNVAAPPKTATASPKLLHAVSIVGGVAVLAGFGALAIQRYP